MSEVAGNRSMLASGAVMAAGTVVSRASGYVRSFLLVAALGSGLHADVFNIANTIPNMLYILLAGGMFNAVLVPQLVRAQKNDADGGVAYTDRVITVAGVFLLAVSLVLVAAAPIVMRLFLSHDYFTADLAAQRESVIAFARFCLPQVFFYGMFVLVGQVLNARGVFGPMMWAPIANNVVAVAVLAMYLVGYGAASGSALCGGFSGGEERLLGIGSTAGIAVQLLILVPYLRRAGIRYRPRFDLRGSGLGHTLRLGVWTVLFVVVNQIAYTLVVRIASGGTASGAMHCGVSTGTHAGTGYTVYANAYLLATVPHAIVTVSLATAMLPRLSALAADGDLHALGRAIGGTLRSTYAVVAPALALLAVLALEAAHIVYGAGAGASSYRDYVPTLVMFTVGLFFFTMHYLLLRGFYAIEQNRRVFFIQCAVSATNIVGAVALTRHISPADTAPRLVVAYTLAYALGAVISYAQLAHQLGGLGTATTLRFAVRTAIAVVLAVGIALLARTALVRTVGVAQWSHALLVGAVVGLVGLAAYLWFARAMRITEVGEMLHLLSRGRIRRPPPPGGRHRDARR